MGLDIGGAPIVKTAGIKFNNALEFNAQGHGRALGKVGYFGAKVGASLYYSGPTGWEINNTQWQMGLHPTNGVFTCPVAGYYAMGWNGIHRGGSGIPAGYNTYGYFAFCKNGVLTYYTHCNQSSAAGNAAWHSGGGAMLFSCAAGDTLALFVNRAPTSVAPDSQSQNMGLYPNDHHAVWCRLVG